MGLATLTYSIDVSDDADVPRSPGELVYLWRGLGRKQPSGNLHIVSNNSTSTTCPA